MSFRSCFAALLLAATGLATCPAAADDVTPSARVSSAVLVRTGPSTDTAILARLRPGDSATLVGEVSGWYIVELTDGRRGYVSKAWTLLRTAPDAEALAANKFKVHVIDVGTGLAIFVEGQDFALLYDAGSQDDLHDGEENRVVAYIRAARPDLRRLDHVILSHPHKDHLQLMPGVFAGYEVGHVWDSGRVNKTDGYCHFLTAAMAEPGARYHDAIASNATRTVTFTGRGGCTGAVAVRQAEMMDARPVDLGRGARMHFLFRDAHPYSDPNENSVVVRLDLGSRRILLTGDAEGGEREQPSTPPSPRSVEAKLLACCKADLRSDVLVVGHHGSLTSSRRAFLDAVGASIYAISSGPYPYHRVRLPDGEIVTELESRGQLFRTDRSDSFRIEDDDRSCELNPRKIGPDADETPGGCDNILIMIDGDRPIAAQYSDLVD
jgi:competence protein ComEC